MVNNCTKCGGEMKEGFPGSYAGTGNIWLNATDSHTKKAVKSLIQKKDKIKSFACTKCGYIERYVQRNP